MTTVRGRGGGGGRRASSKQRPAAHEEGGGRLASFFPHGRRLPSRASSSRRCRPHVFLIYHFAVHTIRNDTAARRRQRQRHARGDGGGERSVVRVDPARPQVLFGASNQLLTYGSTNGGRIWRRRCDPGGARAGLLARRAADRRRPGSASSSPFSSRRRAATSSRRISSSRRVRTRAHRWAPVTRVAPAIVAVRFRRRAVLRARPDAAAGSISRGRERSARRRKRPSSSTQRRRRADLVAARRRRAGRR